MATFELSELLQGLAASVPANLSVTGVQADSRAIQKGEAFFALPGSKAHGNSFVLDAVGQGAAAIVTDTPLTTDSSVPVVVVSDVRAAYAAAAAASFAPQPTVTVAVTGTNGKTSVASFVRQIWRNCGLFGASLGTLGVQTDEGLIPGALTTPDPLSLHRTLGDLMARGIDHVALEASSHGLDQRRLDGLRFSAVGFTNLTRDHLDYHADMDAYREAKLRLFRELLADEGAAVVNADDPEHMPFMFAALDRGARLLTVGHEGAFFQIESIENEGFGQRVEGRLVGEPASFHLPLTGAFQVSNALVALGLAISTGAPQDKAIAALETLKGAKGRLELAGQRGGSAVFIDYAHTPDALENALRSLRPYAKNRLTVVFGCGGDRDKGKRPEMGAIAAELADKVIVTDDNPRTEVPEAIRAAIIASVPNAIEIGDRHTAIRDAIAAMGEGEVVLIAGKGHEDYQVIGQTKTHFSDHEEVAAALGQ